MQDWARRLDGEVPYGPEHEWLGPDGARIGEQLGRGAVSWATEVGEAVASRMVGEVPELATGAAQFSVLRRTTTSTTLRALMLATGLDEPQNSLISAEAVENARDAARRGLQLEDLLRVIRVGYAVLARALLDAVVDAGSGAAELRRVSILLFEVLDHFTGAITTAFVDEQRAREADASAARLDLVNDLLAGRPVDEGEASRGLGYPLDADHIGLIVSGRSPGSPGGVELRHVVDSVFGIWGTPRATLLIPVGAGTLWAWAAFGPPGARRDRRALPDFSNVTVAVGQPDRGVAGFVRSHLEAEAVEHLRSLPGCVVAATVDHRDIELEALLLVDPDAARRFTARCLRQLAGDDPRVVELRSTLELYLDHDHRLGEVAELKHISRNTVTYRVQRALALCEHPAGESTTRLRTALLIERRLAGGGERSS